MDTPDTLHRRARLRELIECCFGGTDARFIEHLVKQDKGKVNQGEISSLQKDNGPKSFGEKRAIKLAEQAGLNRRWFDMPLGMHLDRADWMKDLPLLATSQQPSADALAPELQVQEALHSNGTASRTIKVSSDAQPASDELTAQALDILGQVLDSLNHNLKEAGRNAIVRWASGASTAGDAVSTLSGLMVASREMRKSAQAADLKSSKQDAA